MRIGPFTIARTAELDRQIEHDMAEAMKFSADVTRIDLSIQAVATQVDRLKWRKQAAAYQAANADLQAACQAADHDLHTRYPQMDAEQQALCAQLVDACALANAVNLEQTDTRLSPEARARLQDRIAALLA